MASRASIPRAEEFGWRGCRSSKLRHHRLVPRQPRRRRPRARKDNHTAIAACLRHNVPMTPPTWLLLDLRVRTPRLELRYVDDELATELPQLAALGIHDADTMPFGLPWTDVPSPQLERNALQFYWRCRADMTPTSWSMNLATLVDGKVVGSTALETTNFPTLREFGTGSCGTRVQNRIGKEMRRDVAPRLSKLRRQYARLPRGPTTPVARRGAQPRLRLERDPSGIAQKRRWSAAFRWSRRLRAPPTFDDITLHGVGACPAGGAQCGKYSFSSQAVISSVDHSLPAPPACDLVATGAMYAS